MAVAINIDGLTKRFGETVAVDNVSLDIEPGELFFLLGPSGCGKTTLLRSVAGFVEPDAGSIRLGGEDITDQPAHLRDTGMVFQNYALWPHLTVAQNVAFGLEMRRFSRSEIRRRVEAALATVLMPDHGTRRPNQLSGGQQQRVALARALVVEPRCLLLDEPLSNLDAKLRLDMRGEIRRICKSAGLTSIYVTHDQKEALSIADRIAIMRDGQIVQMGTPLEVYRHPASSFVASFIGEANFLPGTIQNTANGKTTIATSIGTWVSRSKVSAAPGAAVQLCIRPEALHFDEPPQQSPNLFEGQLRDTVYLGEIAQHRFCLTGTDGATVEFKACELNPRQIARDAPAAARAWIAPEDVVVLTE